MAIDLILGTAGHIDHGKTALIRALTGTDTDRLPEEKKRGITIELGFAQFRSGDVRLGIVDVPGHERFVRQMLAGATGMDIVMLVVAADDSVKQQTREHLDVLKFLGIPSGLVVLTKCDLADPEWIELVEAEVEDLVRGSFLEGAPMLRTSAATGQGLDQLREELVRLAHDVEATDRMQRADMPFRMAIDRTFPIEGHGTVVTGSVLTGKVRVGDTLTLEPAGTSVRVRALQNHDQSVEEVGRGQRAAINLGGVHYDDVARGNELCQPDAFRPARRLTVQLELLPHARRSLKQREAVRLHLGTDQWVTRVVLHGVQLLKPGERAWAQMVLPRPAIATLGQPYVLRCVSPMETIGGGQVLSTDVLPWNKLAANGTEKLDQLTAEDPHQRAAAAIYFFGVKPWSLDDLSRAAAVTDAEPIVQALRAQDVVHALTLSSSRSLLVHQQVLEQLAQEIIRRLDRAHDRQPRLSILGQQALDPVMKVSDEPAVVQCVLERLAQQGIVRRTPKGLGLTSRQAKLSANEQKLFNSLIERFRAASLDPPSVDECVKSAAHNRDAVRDLLALAVAEGHLVSIRSEFYLHSDVEAGLRDQLKSQFQQQPELTVSQIKEILQTTRKYAVPLCEYFDEIGFTRRQGNARVLAASR